LFIKAGLYPRFEVGYYGKNREKTASKSLMNIFAVLLF